MNIEWGLSEAVAPCTKGYPAYTLYVPKDPNAFFFWGLSRYSDFLFLFYPKAINFGP